MAKTQRLLHVATNYHRWAVNKENNHAAWFSPRKYIPNKFFSIRRATKDEIKLLNLVEHLSKFGYIPPKKLMRDVIRLCKAEYKKLGIVVK